MDRETSIRKAYYDTLNGNITYNGKTISIVDMLLKDNMKDDIFIVLFGQSSKYNNEGNNKIQSWNSLIEISVIHKQSSSATRDVVDAIGEQIENLISPDTKTTGLLQPSGWQILNPYVDAVDYLKGIESTATQIVLYKSITFSHKVVKALVS